jgi:hypothetical protein
MPVPSSGSAESFFPMVKPGSLSVDTWFSLPLVKAGGFAAAILFAGWTARGYMQQINGGIDNATVAINSVRDEVRRMRADVYTRTDHRIWSYELEKANAGRIVVPSLHVSASPDMP